jgi:aspartyl-tRNA(Asn)/glutamyl-tRNA(Gln) amidotransferase subunit C
VAEVSLDDVRHVARLARMALSDEELERVRRELNRIMGYFAELQQLDTEGVEDTSHAIRMNNVYRPDDIGPSTPTEKLLQNAPDSVENFFRVPAFMEEE